VGYLPLATEDPRDPVSRRLGALDAAAGAAGVVAAARELGMAGPLSAKRVFASARRGDPVAQRVVELEAGRIALAIAAIVPVIDPELVVLGGGIGSNGDLLLERVERDLASISPFRPRIDVSVLGEEASLHGAVATALQSAQTLLFARGAEAGGHGNRR
jgi:predicted NBD/HSP70 family sugar kinase